MILSSRNVLSLFVALSTVGCQFDLFKRVDVPGVGMQPGMQAAFVAFDLGMAGAPRNIWGMQGNLAATPSEFTLLRFDGTAWARVTPPPVFLESTSVPSIDVEALADDSALLLTTRKNGGAIVGHLEGDGTFIDLSATVPSGAVLRSGVSLQKRQGVAFLRVGDTVFRFEGGAFTRLPPAEETAFIDPAAESDDNWVRAGDTNWRLISGTFYHVFPDDETKVAKLEVLRSVGGALPKRTLLKAAEGDLLGAGGEIYGSVIITESYGVMGLVRGTDDSMWVSIVHANSEVNELIFRKVVGDTISKEERFGLDLKKCSLTTIQPECYNPRFLGGQWPSGSPIIFGSGLLGGSSISALLTPLGELR